MVARHQGLMSLRQAATKLDIEPWRMARLGRYLHLDVDATRIPPTEIERAQAHPSADTRYLTIVRWLISAQDGDG